MRQTLIYTGTETAVYTSWKMAGSCAVDGGYAGSRTSAAIVEKFSQLIGNGWSSGHMVVYCKRHEPQGSEAIQHRRHFVMSIMHDSQLTTL
jgi:hypothetical protein